MRISDWSSDVCSSDLIFSGRVAALADGLVEIATPAGDFEVVRNPAKDLARDDATTFVVSGDRIQLTKDQPAAGLRSEEHTSELQSLMRISYAVFCLKIKTKSIPCSYITKHTQLTSTNINTDKQNYNSFTYD